MRLESLKPKLLETSALCLPFILPMAFVFSYWNGIGTALILAISAWYLALNWREVLTSRWALLVMGFFAAIALKDLVALALGDGSFKAFAKSGSRVFILAGSAALLQAYPRRKVEDIFAKALGATAVAMTFYWFNVRYRLGWPLSLGEVMHRNTPGLLSLWLPLYATIAADRQRGEKAWLFRLGAFALGEIFLVILSLAGGWRVGPIAFAFISLIVALKGKIHIKTLSTVLYAASIIALLLIVAAGPERVNDILTGRLDLWRGYTAMAAERPIFGWGYTEEADNIRILGNSLEGTMIFQSFKTEGLGGHNSHLTMLFENGLFALAGFIAMFAARTLALGRKPDFFDLAFIAFIFLIASDTINPGGLRFLGYFLGICLLAKEHKADEDIAATRSVTMGEEKKKKSRRVIIGMTAIAVLALGALIVPAAGAAADAEHHRLEVSAYFNDPLVPEPAGLITKASDDAKVLKAAEGAATKASSTLHEAPEVLYEAESSLIKIVVDTTNEAGSSAVAKAALDAVAAAYVGLPARQAALVSYLAARDFGVVRLLGKAASPDSASGIPITMSVLNEEKKPAPAQTTGIILAAGLAALAGLLAAFVLREQN